MVFEMVNVDDAVRPFAEFFDRFFAAGIEFIVEVENCQFADAVESSLNLDSRCSTAGTDDDHFFADVFNAFVFEGLHGADAVGDRAGQDAVIVDDGVAGADNLRSRGQFVEVLRDRSFVGHGNVPAADFHGAKAFYRIFQGRVVDFKADIDVIET